MRKYFAVFYLFILTTIVSAQPTQITVRAYSQGYYRQQLGRMVAVIDSVMYPSICDTVKVGIIDPQTNQAILCRQTLIGTDGYALIYIPVSYNNRYFKVFAKFRNTFHLLSRDTFLFQSQNLFVDLTIPQNTCCHFDTVGGIAKAFSGEINQDGWVDIFDNIIFGPDYDNHVTGYCISDLTGDNVVDTFDFMLFDNADRNFYTDDFHGQCTPSRVEIDELRSPSFNIFPNPAASFFYLESSSRIERFHVYDGMGRHCMSKDIKDATTKIDCSALRPGIYYLTTEQDAGTLSRPLIILPTTN